MKKKLILVKLAFIQNPQDLQGQIKSSTTWQRDCMMQWQGCAQTGSLPQHSEGIWNQVLHFLLM